MSNRVLAGMGLFFMWASVANAEVTLPRIFQDKMVFQRDEPIAVWGTASPGERVEVSLDGTLAETVADADGNWELELPARPAGGPFKLNVNDRALDDVYLGDVWVLSGQSNAFVPFDYFLKRSGLDPKYRKQFEDDLETCGAEKMIRHYLVARRNRHKEYYMHGESSHPENVWLDTSDPDEVRDVSPVAHYFARELSRKTSVMTAVIRIAWGGNVIEKFLPGGNNHTHMVTPWAHHKIKGVIWYQGESNIIDGNDGLGYAPKLQSLIRGYRELWENPQLPFLIVQLPACQYSHRDGCDEVSLPLLLEAQRQALQIPFTSMAVATDLGAANDLHPPQKYEVAIRLANLALADVHHDPHAVPAGPQMKRFRVEGNRVMVSFETFGSDLATSDGKMPRYFEVAAAKQEFKPAEAKIEGHTVVLWNDEIDQPHDVRYGFDESVLMKLNLTNADGIPAAVFWAGAQNQRHPGLFNEMKKQAGAE